MVVTYGFLVEVLIFIGLLVGLCVGLLLEMGFVGFELGLIVDELGLRGFTGAVMAGRGLVVVTGAFVDVLLGALGRLVVAGLNVVVSKGGPSIIWNV